MSWLQNAQERRNSGALQSYQAEEVAPMSSFRFETLAGSKTRAFVSLMLAMLAPASNSTRAAEAVPALLDVRVTSPGNGFISLGIYDRAGTLVRSLAAAKEVSAGEQHLAWDATTDLGLSIWPGNYAVRGVWFRQGPAAKYVMKVGISGDPPWPLADGTGGWGGNLFPPQDLCCNGRDLVAVFGCVEDNLNTGVQRMTAEGKVIDRYHTFFGWDIRLACAMDDANLYLAIANGAGEPHRLVLARYALGNPAGKIIADIPAGNHAEAGGRWKGRWTCDVRGLAVSGGRVYVPVLLDNKLFVLDASSGKLLNSIDVDSPRGVTARGSDIYLLSGTHLVKLNADGATTATVIKTGLDDPSGVAIDKQGRFFISDRGASQQIKVFAPDGTFIRANGSKGGRPRNGRFDPGGLLDPRGLCIGPDGNVWVASSAEDFQRVSVWGTEGAGAGKLVREFFNTRISSGQGKLSPDRSEMLFIHDPNADAPGVSAYKIDWVKKAWYPSWHYSPTYDQLHQDDVLLGNKHIFGQLGTAFDGRAPYLSFAGDMVKADNGHTYLTGEDMAIYRFDDPSQPPHLASLVYTHRVHRIDSSNYEGDYDQGPNNWLTWSDLDGAGRMSAPGVRFTSDVKLLANVGRLMSWQLEKDMSITMLTASRENGSENQQWALDSLPARKVLADGTPIYDWADLKVLHALAVPDYSGGDGWKGGAIDQLQWLRTEDGLAFTRSEPRPARGAKIHLSGIDGDGWWSSRNWRLSPMAYDIATGQPRWVMLGRRAPGKAKPGEMYYPWNISGHVDGCCFVPDTLGQTWVWTDTGLYLGKLYNDFTAGIRDANGVFTEVTNSFAYKVNGTIYNCMGDHGVFIHEVQLPKLTPLDGGTITVTPQAAAAAKPWDPDGPVPGKKPIYTAHSLWNYDAERAWQQGHPKEPPSARPDFHTHTITVDGDLRLEEWGDIQPAPIMLDGTKVAEVKVAFDKTNLYLAYDVTDPVGFKNAGTELPTCPFTSGAYVDFCIGRDWSTPGREENREGDVRVILAPIHDSKAADYQMGFYPIRKKFAKAPQTITSPAAQRHFDDISPLPGLKWAWKPTAHGYTVEVEVPMEPGQTLNLYPSRDSQIGFDASVGFANSAGTVRQRAAHWAGESEAAVVDRPGSAALLPATWGTLVFERSTRPANKESKQ
jgi:hypothetical protein